MVSDYLKKKNYLFCILNLIYFTKKLKKWDGIGSMFCPFKNTKGSNLTNKLIMIINQKFKEKLNLNFIFQFYVQVKSFCSKTIETP